MFVVTKGALGQTRLLPTLTHHMREATQTGEAPLLQRMDSGQTMQLDLVLPLSDQPGLDTFLKALYDPSSPSYRHFLTPEQFVARFGPTQAQYDALENFARTNGFTVVGGTRGGMDVQVTAPVSAIESAFHVSMGVHQHPTENRTFYAPDREPTLALPFQLWHISGLSNYSVPRPLVRKRSENALANGRRSSSSATAGATAGSGIDASFLGSDMRAAYYGSGNLTGANQTLGLLEFQGTNLDDVNLYYSNAGQTLPSTSIQLLSADGTRTSCNPRNCDDTEPTLDITQALGMAPGLKNLIVYIGRSDTAILSAMTSRAPLPMTIGCSWSWSPADQSALDVYFKRMESQGQTFFVASGDDSTWTRKQTGWPADDAYVVTVGGTDLRTTGAGGAWLSETAWANSGGGVSKNNIEIPSWQQLPGVINGYNNGSTTLRNGPDVAANADFSFYVCANGSCTANEYGGTSFAAPMWAAYVALANEQAATNGGAAVGFLNPTIYGQNAGNVENYSNNFHDIATGISGGYAAVSGYDLVTGWGSPTPSLLDALVNQSASVSASPASLKIAPGSSAATTVTVNSCCSETALSSPDLPAGFSVSFSPASITGSGTSVLTILVGSGVKHGTYTIPVSATGNGSRSEGTIAVKVKGSSSTLTLSTELARGQ
jgi:subtilase family serine protease